MLPLQNRLPGYLISATIRNGRQSSIWPITIIALKRQIEPNNSLPFVPRFAFLVPKKTATLSTQRNRIKRLLRESVRYLLPTLPFPIDGVVMVKGSIEQKTQKDVEALLVKLLQNLLH